MYKSSNNVNLVNKEKRLMCPYNPAHFVDPLRMAIHLIKCKKAYPNIRMSVCPFNATHHVREENLSFHIRECKDKAVVEKALFLRQHPEMSFVARSRQNSIQSSSSSFESSEASGGSKYGGDDWDTEIEHSVSYNPERNIVYKEFSRLPPQGLGKAGRKLWREVDCLRIQRLKDGKQIEDLVYPTPAGGEISIAEIVGTNVSGIERENEGIFVKETIPLPPKPNPIMRSNQPIRRPHIQNTRIAADIFSGKTMENGTEGVDCDDPSKGAIKKDRRKNFKDLLKAVETKMAEMEVSGQTNPQEDGKMKESSIVTDKISEKKTNHRSMAAIRRMALAFVPSNH